ncbi:MULTISPECIES: hypothetical protein [unclassified Streptomyces]|uniref:hypothetical protein n=1 Tax=unclassified Streptomyces TaxID=2593676 RepID=UPI0011CEB004|nr:MULTISPECIES: hypothetical protein [unclassified Streptomyces]TXS71197.1 hypothetical protein EAO69_22830 [Streptomyces sp. me109]
MTGAPAAGATHPANAVQTGLRIEDVLDRLAATGDPAVRAAAEELVQALMDFYGAGLARVLQLLSAPGNRRAQSDPVAPLLGDELVASLLVLHDLHPEDRATRIARALDTVREHELDAVDFDETTGTLTLRSAAAAGGGCGCAANGTTARQAAEDALACFAPEVTAVEVRSDGAPGEPPLLQIGLGPDRRTAGRPAPAKSA